MNYLLDSNVIIDSLAVKLSPSAMSKMTTIVNNGFFISVITKIEVLGFVSVDKQLNDKTEKFINLSKIIVLSPEIVQKTIDLRKDIKIKLPDAIIAASALIHDLTLLTHNISDFNKISGLNVLDSYSL
jgi:predicted nucleic acid-binding protein